MLLGAGGNERRRCGLLRTRKERAGMHVVGWMASLPTKKSAKRLQCCSGAISGASRVSIEVIVTSRQARRGSGNELLITCDSTEW